MTRDHPFHIAAGSSPPPETSYAGELLFKSYLAERGYEVRAYEPDLGNGKRPDYLIHAGGHDIVVEVKSFDPPLVPLHSSPSGCVRSPSLDPIRNQIKKAAAQLKGIDCYPLVVALANPLSVPTPLAPDHVIQAMYGDLEFRIEEGGENTWRVGGNGRLHVEEPDGSKRGYHPYISAVVVLHSVPAADARATAWLRQHGDEHANPLAAYSTAVTLAEREASTGEVVRLDVFEAVSAGARQLPREIFNGPYDTRWGTIRPGYYGGL
jgi:hypothetical protein